MRRKILSISYEYPPIGGGGAKVARDLSNKLRSSSFDIDFVTMWFKGLKRRECLPHMTIYRTFCWRGNISVCRAVEMIPYLVTAFISALRLTRKNNYLVNQSHFIFPDGLICLLLKKFTGLPYVITAHGSDVPGYNPDRFKRIHVFLQPIWKAIVHHAAVIVCPSKTIQSLVLRDYPDIKTVIIPNGIETDRFLPNLPKARRVLIVTRMFERKGVQYLIEALKTIDTDFEFHVVGDGPYLDTLKNRAKDIDVNITFHGYLANDSEKLKQLYETSRIFVFTSKMENFPIVLLEAMTAGLAIISTEGSGCAEVIGEAGILIPACDAQAIQENLLKLIKDEALCHSLGQAARQRVEDRFSWDAVADQYQFLLNTFDRSREASSSTPLKTSHAVRQFENQSYFQHHHK
jgi:glycosyltransferase involved in cell wall biosynthesis